METKSHFWIESLISFSISKDAPGEEKDKDKESKDDEKSAEKKDSTDEAMDTSKAPEVKKENGTDENKSSPRDRLIKDSKLQAAAASGIYSLFFHISTAFFTFSWWCLFFPSLHLIFQI